MFAELYVKEFDREAKLEKPYFARDLEKNSPDIQFNLYGQKFGLELTTYNIDATFKAGNIKAAKRRQAEILKKLSEPIFEIVKSKNSALSKRNWNRIVRFNDYGHQMLNSIPRRNCEGSGPFRNLAEKIASDIVSMYEGKREYKLKVVRKFTKFNTAGNVHFDNPVQFADVIVGSFGLGDELLEILKQKCQKHRKNYSKAKIDECWLLIHSENIEMYEFIGPKEFAEPELKEAAKAIHELDQPFSRIFLMALTDRYLLEVR